MQNKDDDVQPDHIEEYCRQLGLQLRDEQESLINLPSVDDDSQISILGDAVPGDNSLEIPSNEILQAETNSVNFECTKCEKSFTNSRQFLKHKCVSKKRENGIVKSLGKGKKRGRKPKVQGVVRTTTCVVEESNDAPESKFSSSSRDPSSHLSDHTYIKDGEDSNLNQSDLQTKESVPQCESCQLLTEIDPETGKIPCKKCDELMYNLIQESKITENCTEVKRRKYCFKTEKKDCPHCFKGFHSDKRLEKHLALCKKNLICGVCHKDFSDNGRQAYSQYQQHYYTHFDTKPYTCTICSKGFIRKGDLDRHQLVHTENYSPKRCNECGAVFTTEANLARHRHKHNRVSLSCKKCGLQFVKQSTLDKHMAACQTETSCEICGKVFNCLSKNLKNRYQEHMLIHTGEKPFKCQFCERGFRDRSTRRKHERTHTGEKPYPCTMCERAFSQLRLLRNHVRTHTGEKPYACELCTLRFAKPCNLKYHMRVHTGEKPYTCSVCKKSFTQSGTYHKHVRRHTEVERVTASMIAENREDIVEKNIISEIVNKPVNSDDDKSDLRSSITATKDFISNDVTLDNSEEIIHDIVSNGVNISREESTDTTTSHMATITNEDITIIVSETEPSLTTIDVEHISNIF